MTILVRPVRYEEESEELLSFLRSNLPGLPHECRFSWRYHANPDGPACSWLARETAKGRIIGVTSVFPRAMWIGHRVKMCSQVGDFVISKSHRSLGPAVLLQRATFDPVDQDKFSLCYDCPPHPAGMSTFRRLGMQPSCAVHRYALPLRVDRHIDKLLGFPAPLPAAAANLLLRAHRRISFPAQPGDLDVCEYVGRFGDEFTELDEALKNPNAIRCRRNAEQLNWRYREDPLQQFHVLTARRKGELIAFLVCTVSADAVFVVDIFGKEIFTAAIALIGRIVEQHEKSQHTIEAFLSDGNALLGPILKAGFRHRSMGAQIVAYAKLGGETSAFIEGKPTWALQQIDIRA